jgi:hypothetical protein
VFATKSSPKNEDKINESAIANNSNISENEDENDEEDVGGNSFNSTTDENSINSWNGNYTDENDNSLTIYRSGENTLTINISNNNSENQFASETYIVEVSSDNTVEYSDTFFEETSNLNLTINSNTIELVCDSTDEDSILNFASGTYSKEDFEKTGWDGMYVSDDYTIVLAETDSNTICITINDYWMRYLDEYTAEEITYEDEFIDDVEKIDIEKTADGLKITSSSTDEEDVLNEISGKEFKFVN